jgi:CRISPR/Cas system-associated exonuclease Cas4 (RecB family)
MAGQFVKLFGTKKGIFDAAKLADILDASYTADANTTETITKTRFAPSTLLYGQGACPRYWHLVFNGAEFIKEHDAYGIDNMQSGTDAHHRMQKNFEASGLDIENEVELINEDPPIRCFVDSIVKDYNGHNVVVEIKTTRAEAFAHLVAKNEGRPYQVMQLLIYMYLLDEQYGCLLYENKNDHQKLMIPVEMTPENKAKVEKAFEWMRMVYANYQVGELPMNPYRSNSRVCKGCPIKKWCFAQEEGTIKLATLSYTTKEKDADSE